MKFYKYDEWDIQEGTEYLDFDHRIYVDKNDELITGMLEGFYCFAKETGKDNLQYVVDGKRNEVITTKKECIGCPDNRNCDNQLENSLVSLCIGVPLKRSDIREDHIMTDFHLAIRYKEYLKLKKEFEPDESN